MLIRLRCILVGSLRRLFDGVRSIMSFPKRMHHWDAASFQATPFHNRPSFVKEIAGRHVVGVGSRKLRQ